MHQMLPLEERREKRYLELWHCHCMSNRAKSCSCIVNNNNNTENNDMVCISTELANVIHEKAEKN